MPGRKLEVLQHLLQSRGEQFGPLGHGLPVLGGQEFRLIFRSGPGAASAQSQLQPPLGGVDGQSQFARSDFSRLFV
jgi:hypothetical protein